MSSTHGHRIGKPSPTYATWRDMHARCSNPAKWNYKNYGGRGIKVCKRWMKFENFLADMGVKPEGKTIDKFPNNNGNYEPRNCRWATPKEQSRNKRDNTIFEINGEKKCQCEWCEIFGISSNLVTWRIKAGWGTEEAFKTPVGSIVNYRKAKKSNKTGFLGVSKEGRKFVAQLTFKGVPRRI